MNQNKIVQILTAK